MSPSTDLNDLPSISAPRNALLIERATPSARSPMRSSSSDTSPSSRPKLSGKRSSPIGKTLHQSVEFIAAQRSAMLAHNGAPCRSQFTRRHAPEVGRRQPQYAEP